MNQGGTFHSSHLNHIIFDSYNMEDDNNDGDLFEMAVNANEDNNDVADLFEMVADINNDNNAIQLANIDDNSFSIDKEIMHQKTQSPRIWEILTPKRKRMRYPMYNDTQSDTKN